MYQCRPQPTQPPFSLPISAIGALYAFALDKTGKVRVTAVCRWVD